MTFTEHPTTGEGTLFSGIHGTFNKTEHILGHKTNIKFKRISKRKNRFSYHSTIILEINNIKILAKEQSSK